jgi:hypothetical protein
MELVIFYCQKMVIHQGRSCIVVVTTIASRTTIIVIIDTSWLVIDLNVDAMVEKE